MTERVLYALAWALAHSLWQQGALAFAFWLVHRQATEWTASRRYLIGCAAMVLAVVAPLATFALIYAGTDPAAAIVEQRLPMPPAPVPNPDAAPVVANEPAAIASAAPAPVAPVVDVGPLVGPVMQTLLIAWLIGVALLGARFLGGWVYLQQMRWIGVAAPPEQWRRLLEDLAPRLGVFKPVWMYESRQAVVPTLVGWLRPVVLLPVGMLTNLTPEQVEAVLAHELAHVRRHDYLVNLLQSLAEVFYFHSPGVWVLSHLIREEREYCCDDLAVAATGNRLALGQALAQLARTRRAAVLQPAVAATGGGLLARVRRIVVPAPTRPASARSVFASLLGIAFVAMALLPMVNLHAHGAGADEQYVEEFSPARHRYFLLGRKVITLQATDITLKEACFRLYTQTGIEIDLPPEAEAQRVTLDFDQVSGDRIVGSIFNLLEMDHTPDLATGRVQARYWPGSGPRPGEVVRVSLDYFHARQTMFRAFKHEARWTSREQVTLGEGLRRLNELCGLKFELESPAMSGLVVEAYMPDGTARDALHSMIKPLGLEYRYMEDSRLFVYRPAAATGS